MVTGDYVQSIPVPRFSVSQSEEMYYYSEAVVNVFGIGDKSLDVAKLFAYLYMEGEAKKGGNNVASVMIDYMI